MVYVSENCLKEFVGEDGTAIGKPKERMISEHSLDTVCPGMQDALVTQGTECLHRKNTTDHVWVY